MTSVLQIFIYQSIIRTGLNAILISNHPYLYQLFHLIIKADVCATYLESVTLDEIWGWMIFYVLRL
jgi:hypothetical protein